MSEDVEQMVAALRVLDRAGKLFREEAEHLRDVYGRTAGGDTAAGGPSQTLIGIRELQSAAERSVEELARAIGYTVAGQESAARRATGLARHRPIGIPSGADRMARPLGERTVQGLELVKGIEGFFSEDVATVIDISLAAPEATWPPADWEAFARESTNRPPT
ncbi:hypothetical protein [Streptomyces sp. NBC_01217]|uniref:hypothetical protein n=1 Tax=Streptomyces sp. NBC_01217 TaxID=2903779 RepID=UPI002E0D8A01|nr:hypothetical protein OG507_22760 [Streptomyces sp. NBC_01217]